MDHEEYIREMFDTYLGENNVSIEKLARDCISSGKDYSDCEAKFNRELRRLAKEFQEVIGDYMGDDVVYAVGSAYDFAALQEKFLDLAAEFSGRESETGVNLTGGTKLMTIAAQQVFWQDFPCFYINPERNSILSISEEGAPEYPIAGQLKIRDFFAIHGYQADTPTRKEMTAKTGQLCRTLLGECSRYGEPLKVLNYLAGKAKNTLVVREKIPEKVPAKRRRACKEKRTGVSVRKSDI